jgi:hypothetical protein
VALESAAKKLIGKQDVTDDSRRRIPRGFLLRLLEETNTATGVNIEITCGMITNKAKKIRAAKANHGITNHGIAPVESSVLAVASLPEKKELAIFECVHALKAAQETSKKLPMVLSRESYATPPKPTTSPRTPSNLIRYGGVSNEDALAW